jgi:TRAP-type C4-dicarboxylate transport system substrate-binding protein
MKRKRFSVCGCALFGVFLANLTISGYVSPVSAASPANIQPITLKCAYHAADSVNSACLRLFGEAVTAKTGGKVKFEYFWMGALGDVKEQVINLGGGLFDISLLIQGYYPSDMPLTTVGMLPFFSDDNLVMARAGTQVFDMKEIQQEHAKLKIKPLMAAGSAPYIYMGKKSIKKVADFKGNKVRVTGMQAETLKALGAVPVNLSVTEAAMSIDRGTIDSSCSPTTAFNSAGIQEVSKYATFYGQGAAAWPIAMNLNRWNKLQPELQMIMMDVRDEVSVAHSKAYAKMENETYEGWKKKYGIEIYRFPPEERKAAAKLGGEPVWNNWLKQMKAKGLPGELIFKVFNEAVDKYEK